MLEVKTSDRENAGVGVFATKFIEKGKEMTSYKFLLFEDFIHPSNAELLAKCDVSDDDLYFYLIHQRYGMKTPWGIMMGYSKPWLEKMTEPLEEICGSLINDYFDDHENYPKESKRWNTTIDGDTGKMVSIRDIEEGEELYMKYGEGYWAAFSNINEEHLKNIHKAHETKKLREYLHFVAQRQEEERDNPKPPILKD